MKILSTTDYKIFKSVKGNRKVNARHVERLTASVADNNMLETNPIIVNDKMEIIDGQHRLAAASALAVPIFYVILPLADLGQVQLMNANMKPWSMEDYLDSYISMGNAHYKKLREFTSTYDLPITVGANLLYGEVRSLGNRTAITHLFKTGEFEVRDEKGAKFTADYITAVREYFEPAARRHRDLFYAIQALIRKDIPEAMVVSKLKAAGEVQPRKSSTRDYLRIFEDVLNKNAKAGHSLRLY